MSNSEIDDVRAIVTDLQKAIRRQQMLPGEPGTEGPVDPLADVARYQRVNGQFPIGWPTMPKGLIPKLVAYTQKIVRRLLRWYIDPIVNQQNAYNAAVAKALMAFYAQSEQLALREQGLESRLVQLQQTRDAQIQGLSAYLRELQQSELAAVTMRLQRLEHWRRREASSPEDVQPVSASPPVTASPDVDYFVLGALYRNDKQMASFLSDYDDVFTTLHQSQQRGSGPAGPVLDIGCGRGEFAAHLESIGLAVYGIDIDVDAVEMGQAAQRDVRQEDAFVHLSNLPDHSLAAVTLIQVIEHFEAADVMRLFRLAFQKLAPGGLLLAETINPTCLLALSNWYLMDPSHRTPLHPQTTRFLMEQAEFERVTVRLLHPVPDGGKLALLPAVENAPDLKPWADCLNYNLEKLNDFLYGHQDYAAIAYKVVEDTDAADTQEPGEE